jgi:SAM-dependent methyltransferase
MNYKYLKKDNYEDFSSGRFFYHKPNYSNYPVRLAGELFCRCLEYIDKTDEIVLYDPCCGSGYMLTVLGYLFNDKIKAIYASDISVEAIELAEKNLSLLWNTGIEGRKNELRDLYEKYARKPHKDALGSLDKLRENIRREIEVSCYIEDILNKNKSIKSGFIADIVMTDVPYGSLSAWSDHEGEQINTLLETLKPVITQSSIISISHNKSQKLIHNSFKKMEVLKIGRRVIELVKLNGSA